MLEMLMLKEVHVRTAGLATVAVLALCSLCAPTGAHAAAKTSRALTAETASGANALCPAAPLDADLVVAHAATSTPLFGYNQGVDMRDDTGYNGDYLFAMTKGVASSAMTPALKPLLFLLTVPLDIVTLPFTAIAGFF
jgi:ABC-type amino acid transport substrate-binding protein